MVYVVWLRWRVGHQIPGYRDDNVVVMKAPRYRLLSVGGAGEGRYGMPLLGEKPVGMSSFKLSY